MPVDVELDEGVAVVTINRPDALNALNLELLTDLRTRLAELADDHSARTVVLTGAGERAFAAGADIKYMSGLGAEEAREALERSVVYAAARMIQTAYEYMFYAPQITTSALYLLQLSLNILKSPREATAGLLAL